MAQTNGLWQRYKTNGDLKAREELILAYAYLAKYVVDRMNLHPSAALGYDDMISYAVVGLIDAVERFDMSREVKFETYAVTRIRGSVLDAIKSLDWVPRSVRGTEQELRRVISRLEAEFGYPPSDEETADAMGISVDEFHEMLDNVGHSAMVSLDELILYGEDCSDENRLLPIADAEGDPVFSVELEARKELLACAISQLPEREKLVISLYYKEDLTLKEIAQVIGVTESRVCQLHSKAVLRLQGKLARHSDLMLAAA